MIKESKIERARRRRAESSMEFARRERLRQWEDALLMYLQAAGIPIAFKKSDLIALRRVRKESPTVPREGGLDAPGGFEQSGKTHTPTNTELFRWP